MQHIIELEAYLLYARSFIKRSSPHEARTLLAVFHKKNDKLSSKIVTECCPFICNSMLRVHFADERNLTGKRSHKSDHCFLLHN